MYALSDPVQIKTFCPRIGDLQWLLWAFGDDSKNKRKKNLIPLILDHLKKETPFSKEALTKDQIFTY
ncbi:hypothetical protein Glove_159g6 [Diversispora epigaea]|uniref:Uncharacterized protein n=1 Tax=Diversispora epigaea TaxID=1348612 RepID=A0A397J123_9GLOM|nr:hypothetical protein Glove_159g6 [Diversispora epigaea]